MVILDDGPCGRNVSRARACIYILTQDVPGAKITNSEFNSRADAESKTSYTHGPNSQRFRSFEFLKYSK